MQVNGQQSAISGSELWEWVATRRATESPRGDFIRRTRQNLRLLKEKHGDNWEHHLPTLNMDPQQEKAYWQMRSQYDRQLRKQGTRQEPVVLFPLSDRSGPVSDEVTLPNGQSIVLASPHRRLAARVLDFVFVLTLVALTGEQFAQSGLDMRTSDNPNALIDIGYTFFEILLILVYLGIVELAW